jgi:hypothetical protein
MQIRTLRDLINTVDPAWPLVQEWIRNARNHVEVLPAQRERSEATLVYLQVTTRSPLGAVALETGGMFIDHGWLRILGSGHQRMQGTLQTWNSPEHMPAEDRLNDALLIAHDVVGGFYALNGGAFAGTLGNVFYFAPDTLRWEDAKKTYSGFLQWALSGNLDLFYENVRWPHWEQDLAMLSGDQGLSIYPFLFLQKDLPMIQRSRRVVPMRELWYLYRDLARQLAHLPPGTPIRFVFTNDERKEV